MAQTAQRLGIRLHARMSDRQTISTKFVPATNTKGSRIRATSTNGDSITIGCDHSLSIPDRHLSAAYQLACKLNWDGSLVGGSTKTGYTFVFEDF